MATNIDQLPELATTDEERRTLAIRRIKERNDFKVHVMLYLLVNATLVVIWAFTGAHFFWPIFVIAPWGIAVVLNAYAVYRGNVITEEQIEREMRRLPS